MKPLSTDFGFTGVPGLSVWFFYDLIGYRSTVT